jgi:hypothetical protein
VRSLVVFLLLLAIKVASRFFYRHEVAWGGEVPPQIWKGLRLVARQVVPISRERDDMWSGLLGAILPGGLVVIAPEGRMMCETGLDVTGR